MTKNKKIVNRATDGSVRERMYCLKIEHQTIEEFSVTFYNHIIYKDLYEYRKHKYFS